MSTTTLIMWHFGHLAISPHLEVFAAFHRHMIIIYDIFARHFCLLLVSNKNKKKTWRIGLLNDHHKQRLFGPVVTHFMSDVTYDQNCGINYNCKLRTTCRIYGDLNYIHKYTSFFRYKCNKLSLTGLVSDSIMSILAKVKKKIKNLKSYFHIQ